MDSLREIFILLSLFVSVKRFGLYDFFYLLSVVSLQDALFCTCTMHFSSLCLLHGFATAPVTLKILPIIECFHSEKLDKIKTLNS